MEIQLVSSNVVVLGDRHNPTIVNRDFLEIQNIVPKDWGWEVLTDEVITIPPFAQVPFKNGVIVQVEPHKAQFMDQNIGDPKESKIVDIAIRFVHTLKHVRYKAVGINFNCLYEVERPEEFIINRFLRKGDWSGNRWPLKSIGIKMAYAIGESILNLQIDPGTARYKADASGRDRNVLLLNANFHRDCSQYPADDEIEAHLQHYMGDWNTLTAMVQDLIK
jgi:hypothetical protein